jgi:hypothetical protein
LVSIVRRQIFQRKLLHHRNRQSVVCQQLEFDGDRGSVSTKR